MPQTRLRLLYTGVIWVLLVPERASRGPEGAHLTAECHGSPRLMGGIQPQVPPAALPRAAHLCRS